MAVSVIVPVHNAADFLGPTLSSIANALESRDQLILVFDSCTDQSVETFLRWRRNQIANIEFEISVKETNCGSVSGSRNVGIELVNREWLTFADHDDRVLPRAYRDMERVGNHEVDVVRAGYIKQVGQDYEVVYPKYSPDMYAFYGIFVWNSLFSVDMIRKNNIEFIAGYGEDYEFNLNIAKVCKSQGFLRKPVYTWMIHGNNQHLSRKPVDFANRVLGIFDRHHEYFHSNHNALAVFVQWVEEYTTHLKIKFPDYDIAADWEKRKDLVSLLDWKLLSSF
ncbi:hypothetical protein CPJ18_26175 [Agrobacterium rosae]|uniref:Glycosyltransferase 2-like domain-containing protein n=1 Tax=Agrobacterium rosae TaxID=1972867 RepID=A0AAE5RSR0_9HYPH|nr:glycosyltransferase family A protein [Agrobacterium rosae]POO48414.1 hypothetical protein CPJ18_26175 [Agrobacterium rosae]